MAKKAAPRKKAKAVKSPAKPKPKQAAGGKVVAPENQRLRFFYKYWTLALMERAATSTGYSFTLQSSAVLNDINGKRKTAIIYRNSSNELVLESKDIVTIPAEYGPAKDILFSKDECSFWNDYSTGGDHLIVIGTGDIRNLNIGTDMDPYLWEWTIGNDDENPIYIQYAGVNFIKVYAPVPPTLVSKK